MTTNLDLIGSILACPKCKGAVSFGKSSLRCPPCGAVYPIHEGIPVLLSSPTTRAEQRELDWTEGKTYFAQKKSTMGLRKEEGSAKVQDHKFAHARARLALAHLLKRMAKSCQSRMALDIGSGGAPLFSGIGTLVTLDMSLIAMTRMLSTGPGNIASGERSLAAVAGKAQELPFKENSFDIAFCSGLLHHLGGQENSEIAATAEMRRVTRPGGYTVALEPNLLNPSGVLMNLVGTLAESVYTNRFGFVPHERSMSPMKLVSVFRNAGFSRIGILGSTYTWDMLPLMLQKGIARTVDRLTRTPPFSYLSGWTIVYSKKC
ncbi:MAG: methyltransferase domain-containing protein [Candidatus Thorarchaeota archaeon]